MPSLTSLLGIVYPLVTAFVDAKARTFVLIKTNADKPLRQLTVYVGEILRGAPTVRGGNGVDIVHELKGPLAGAVFERNFPRFFRAVLARERDEVTANVSHVHLPAIQVPDPEKYELVQVLRGRYQVELNRQVPGVGVEESNGLSVLLLERAVV